MPANTSVKAGLALIQGDKSKVLGVQVGSHQVEPGLYIPRADAQQPPTLSLPALDPTTTYLVIGLDIDAPFPSLDVLGPILHWIQPGLKPTAESTTLKVEEPFIANYIGPAPPPGSSPHRYCFFLYEQPQGLDAKQHAPANGAKLGNMSRMRASLDQWEKKLGLGQMVAMNYFKSN